MTLPRFRFTWPVAPALCVFFGVCLLAQDNTIAPTESQITEFWRATRRQLAAEPMEAVVEPLKDPLPYKKFRVTLRGLDGVRFRAYLAVPVRGESPAPPLPAIITAPGYGGSQQGVMLDECQRGYVILQVFPRSQGISEDLWKIDGAEKLTSGISYPKGYYYQGAYADMIRGIDFLVSRPEVDPERIAIMGTSQGGGIALAVAALDSRIRAVAAHLPFCAACARRRQSPVRWSIPCSTKRTPIARQPGTRSTTSIRCVSRGTFAFPNVGERGRERPNVSGSHHSIGIRLRDGHQVSGLVSRPFAYFVSVVLQVELDMDGPVSDSLRVARPIGWIT